VPLTEPVLHPTFRRCLVDPLDYPWRWLSADSGRSTAELRSVGCPGFLPGLPLVLARISAPLLGVSEPGALPLLQPAFFGLSVGLRGSRRRCLSAGLGRLPPALRAVGCLVWHHFSNVLLILARLSSLLLGQLGALALDAAAASCLGSADG
jgi:hypothetical protein